MSRRISVSVSGVIKGIFPAKAIIVCGICGLVDRKSDPVRPDVSGANVTEGFVSSWASNSPDIGSLYPVVVNTTHTVWHSKGRTSTVLGTRDYKGKEIGGHSPRNMVDNPLPREGFGPVHLPIFQARSFEVDYLFVSFCLPNR